MTVPPRFVVFLLLWETQYEGVDSIDVFATEQAARAAVAKQKGYKLQRQNIEGYIAWWKAGWNQTAHIERHEVVTA